MYDSLFILGQELVIKPLPNSAVSGTHMIARVLEKASPATTKILFANHGSAPVSLRKTMVIAFIRALPESEKGGIQLP